MNLPCRNTDQSLTFVMFDLHCNFTWVLSLFVPHFHESVGTLNLIHPSVCLSHCPSVCHKNFNLGHNFDTWHVCFLWLDLSSGTMSWPWRWPLTYFKVKFVAVRGTTILWICLWKLSFADFCLSSFKILTSNFTWNWHNTKPLFNLYPSLWSIFAEVMHLWNLLVPEGDMYSFSNTLRMLVPRANKFGIGHNVILCKLSNAVNLVNEKVTLNFLASVMHQFLVPVPLFPGAHIAMCQSECLRSRLGSDRQKSACCCTSQPTG